MKKFLKILAIPVIMILLYILLFLAIEFFYIIEPSSRPVIDSNNKNSAILVIDVQNQLTAVGNEKKAEELKIGPFLNNLNVALNKLKNFEAIYIRQEFPRNSPLSFLLPMFPEEGEAGTEINKTIYREKSKIFNKARADAFTNPDLQKYLETKKIGTLYITGLAAESCVDNTIRGALAKGYRVFVIKEAVISMHGGEPDADRLGKYRSYGATVISVNNIK